MAKLTRKQQRAILGTIHHLERAQAFISSSAVAVARKGNFASTALHYTRPDGATLYEIDKEIGSDLTGLPQALDNLRAFLETETAN